MKERTRLLLLLAVLGSAYFLPIEHPRVQRAFLEGLFLLKEYARLHVLLCLVPAFFIAGAIARFVRQGAVTRYLGANARRPVAYGVGAVSGSILAVCSCTVLPLFAGIYRMGAGIGPASAFLYSGPAINALAIILTARILGLELGVARAVGAVAFGVVIGLLMHVIFRRDEAARMRTDATAAIAAAPGRPLRRTALYFAAMVAVLVFANWGRPVEATTGFFQAVWAMKWPLTLAAAVALGAALVAWMGIAWRKLALVAAATGAAALLVPADPRVPFGVAAVVLGAVLSRDEGELGEWFEASWGFAKQILPPLLVGVLVAGALLGRPGHEGWIPSAWVETAVGGNSLRANLLASVAGAFMYFATLTEVPIVQGLLGSGMGKGPALALLLAGPALSLPSMLVLRSVFGWRKTLAYVALVVVMATVAGALFGALV
jgi:hypothetical protein